MKKRVLLVILVFPIAAFLWVIGWGLFHVGHKTYRKKVVEEE